MNSISRSHQHVASGPYNPIVLLCPLTTVPLPDTTNMPPARGDISSCWNLNFSCCLCVFVVVSTASSIDSFSIATITNNNKKNRGTCTFTVHVPQAKEENIKWKAEKCTPNYIPIHIVYTYTNMYIYMFIFYFKALYFVVCLDQRHSGFGPLSKSYKNWSLFLATLLGA